MDRHIEKLCPARAERYLQLCTNGVGGAVGWGAFLGTLIERTKRRSIPLHGLIAGGFPPAGEQGLAYAIKLMSHIRGAQPVCLPAPGCFNPVAGECTVY